jgi:hypothetical protein
MSRPRTVALVEAMGLTWSLGLAYLTAAYFVCYLCGFSVVLLQQMLTWENWGPFWLILGAALAARARHVWRDGWLLLLLAGQIARYTVVFVFSNWQPYVPHAQGTLDRLLLQALPTAVILLVSLLGKHGSVQTGAVVAEEPSRVAAQAA